MIRSLLLACLAILVAFYMEAFLLPSAGIPWHIHLTGLALVLSVRPFPLPIALGLGFVAGCLLTSVGTIAFPIVISAALVAAMASWWVSRHALSQRSLLSVGVVAVGGLLLLWVPEIVRGFAMALERNRPFFATLIPYLLSATVHGLLISMAAYPVVMRARVRDARLQSRKSGW